MRIALALPVFNAFDWALNVDLPGGFDIYATDNNSDDGTPLVLTTRGVRVVENGANLGRIGNWRAAIESFPAGECEWLKWLFAGDELSAGSAQMIERATISSPQARLLCFDYRIAEEGRSLRWSALGESRTLEPIETMALCAERGNVFGSPVGHAVHREALAGRWDFGTLPWVSDFSFCLGIAARHPVSFVAESIGVFHADRRAFWSAQELSVRSSYEEALVRLDAADIYRSLSGDERGYETLLRRIERTSAHAVRARRARRLIRSGGFAKARGATLLVTGGGWSRLRRACERPVGQPCPK